MQKDPCSSDWLSATFFPASELKITFLGFPKSAGFAKITRPHTLYLEGEDSDWC